MKTKRELVRLVKSIKDADKLAGKLGTSPLQIYNAAKRLGIYLDRPKRRDPRHLKQRN